MIPTVRCPTCDKPVIQAERNTPGIQGTEYLEPNETYVQVVVGPSWHPQGVRTKNVWGYQRHFCYGGRG